MRHCLQIRSNQFRKSTEPSRACSRAEGGRNVPLVKEWKDVTTAVSDNESLLNSLKDSPYYAYFQDEAQAWEAKLIFLNEVLPQMVQLQRKWICPGHSTAAERVAGGRRNPVTPNLSRQPCHAKPVTPTPNFSLEICEAGGPTWAIAIVPNTWYVARCVPRCDSPFCALPGSHLEPIFARGALPSEQARFRRVDKDFVQLMKDIEADKRVVSVTRKPELLASLPKAIEQLDRCQKALNEFLEEKRDKFPRFYFIGDDVQVVANCQPRPNVVHVI